jgi:dihydropteroate synthase
MGIINLTPDSFFSESRIDSFHNINYSDYQYADILDIGAESSRPGASPVSEKIELSRISYFLDRWNQFNKMLSIDTYKPTIARYALENGFNMINDIKSGGNNDSMLELAAEYDCPIVLMHMQGNPQTMQINPSYDNIMDEIVSFFEKKIKKIQSMGIKTKKLILDPGIGFGKRVVDNDTILQNLEVLKQFNHPILLGLSRKSFLSINKDGPESRLPATIGATVLAMQKGVDMIRVHDVEATYKLKTILQRISNQKNSNKKLYAN